MGAHGGDVWQHGGPRAGGEGQFRRTRQVDGFGQRVGWPDDPVGDRGQRVDVWRRVRDLLATELG
jgi:hypothetical protein